MSHFAVRDDDTSICDISTGHLSIKKIKNDADNSKLSDVQDLDSNVSHHNQPLLMGTYPDPDTYKEMLFLVAAVPDGPDHIEFSFVGTGPGSSKAQITYSWPPLAYDLNLIFGKAFKHGLPSCHPKVMALKKELENNRDSIDDIPQGCIEISLPIPVQTAPDAIKFQGSMKDGHKIVTADLKAYHKSYFVKQSDKKVKFEEV